MMTKQTAGKPAKKKKTMSESEIDENIKESFPASDPPSWSPGTLKQTPKRPAPKSKPREI